MHTFLYPIVPTAIDVALTAGSFVGIDLILRRRRPFVAAALSSLIVPLLMGLLAIVILLLPNPNHGDLPGLAFISCILLAGLALPISIACSVVVFVVRRLYGQRRLRSPAGFGA
jgi:hypothetical protein